MRKARPYLNKATAIQLYYTFVYPYLGYCNVVWGNACVSYLSKLLLLQKRIVRIIENVHFRAPTSYLFKKFQILKCRAIHKYQMGQFIYKYTEKMLPPLYSYLFILRSSVHDYPTRFSSFYTPWGYSIDLTKRSLRHDGIAFWNSLSWNIKKSPSLNSYKFNLKKFLIGDQI